MCGRRLIDKSFLTLMQHWSGASCVRPVDAARMAAGPNALRGSGPNRKHAFEDASTQARSPDPAVTQKVAGAFAQPTFHKRPRRPTVLSGLDDLPACRRTAAL